MLAHLATWPPMVLLLLVAALVRHGTALWPHSGEHTPPMYGDYEAQRHWMELTLHTSPRDWYRNTTKNDLQYWGPDYPPLTLYLSYLHGAVGSRLVSPDAFALTKESRGYESEESRAYMRATVFTADYALLFPTALALASAISGGRRTTTALVVVAAILLLPPLLIIDHGHFQYNGISLALALAAAILIGGYVDGDGGGGNSSSSSTF
mmetsp:Transcript_9394/g.22318  ORF Transcript_9394/g.22318 Transcript_9394/m.22318 type:complete len:208 (-) Transcript_9394:412-1035(-)